MRFESDGQVLQVFGVTELNASSATAFRDQIRSALQPQHTRLDLEFSDLRFLDSSGLGALIALHKTMVGRQGHVRIVNAQPHVQQVLELTRMHRIFELAKPTE
jgi:anti-sigma B factor antagonist